MSHEEVLKSATQTCVSTTNTLKVFSMPGYQLGARVSYQGRSETHSEQPAEQNWKPICNFTMRRTFIEPFPMQYTKITTNNIFKKCRHIQVQKTSKLWNRRLIIAGACVMKGLLSMWRWNSANKISKTFAIRVQMMEKTRPWKDSCICLPFTFIH